MPENKMQIILFQGIPQRRTSKLFHKPVATRPTTYAILILLAVCLLAFGMTTVKTPFSRVAFAFSESSGDLKEKVREKDPMLRSEIQYLGPAGAPTSLFLFVSATAVDFPLLEGDFFAEAFSASSGTS